MSLPVRFTSGRELPIGTSVPVTYSLADPRNAQVDLEHPDESRLRPRVARAGIVIGTVFIVLAVLRLVF